ncbi:helix-turn-helix domain-containing protein [Microvirga sp. W0021]|uniref:Helix-turn-helix domain-containing protein n=1 Tax=Hohaiivirga grylli TaxID=3133970 RepID=A0ABV0BL23_9HYPH
MSTLGQRIRQARKAKNLTQADVAQYFGIKPGSVSLWESDDTKPELSKLEPLARLLGVTVSTLLGDGSLPTYGMAPDAHKKNNIPTPSEFSEPFDIPPIPRKRIPVYGLAVGGEDGRFEMNGQLIDTVFCPPGYENAPNLYAVYVVGESMEPVFSPGQTVWVHPNRAPRRGDDIIIQVHSTSEEEPPYGFIKRYVSSTPSKVIVEQFNPPKEIEFQKENILSIHKIIMVQK